MNRTQKLIFLGISFFAFNSLQTADTHIYREEFEQLKKSSEFTFLFNEETSSSLKDIRRDIENFQQLTPAQRYIHSPILGLNVLIVTQQTMPKLHAYIEEVCKQQGMKTPVVFISMIKGLYNAFAIKLLKSSGAIVIGEKLLMEVPDDEIEGILAHELGHIKHNHANKKLLTFFLVHASMHYLVNKCNGTLASLKDPRVPAFQKILNVYLHLVMANIGTMMGSALLINKKFEKEADEFAYKAVGKGPELIKFFGHLQQKEQARENDFVELLQVLDAHKSKLRPSDYKDLKYRYNFAKFEQKINQIQRWIYHHTFFGEHPSHENRIKSAQEYLATQKKAIEN